MNYNIKGTEISITDEIRSYVEKRLASMDKFLATDSSAHADVECEYQALRHGDHYRAEFTVVAAGALYRAEAWGATLHTALDTAGEGVMAELRRDKSKRINVVRRSAWKVKEYIRGFRSRF